MNMAVTNSTARFNVLIILGNPYVVARAAAATEVKF
jgi:hypothetical protein